MKLGNLEITGDLVLAPMAGVTDLAFRTICAELGAAVTVTEMVSSRALIYQDKKSRSLLHKTPIGVCGAQIFGNDPSVMADGAVLAQLGVPDMRVPIAYAMTYPRRIPTGSKPLDLFSIGTLTFEPGDPVRFPALRLAGECLNAGGAACTILNGANEMAVAAFLRDEIPFGAISRIVEGTLEACGAMPADTLDDIFHADLEARRVAKEIAEKLK